jgi:hypothetical protein
MATTLYFPGGAVLGIEIVPEGADEVNRTVPSSWYIVQLQATNKAPTLSLSLAESKAVLPSQISTFP